MPGIDILNDSSGDRYSLEVSFAEDDNGSTWRDSGLVTYSVTSISPEEEQRLAAGKTSGGAYAEPTPLIGPRLGEMLSRLGDKDTFPVRVWLDDPEKPEPTFITLEREVATGNIANEEEYYAVRQEVLTERAAHIDSLQDEALGVVDGQASLIRRCEYMPCLTLATSKENFENFFPHVLRCGPNDSGRCMMSGSVAGAGLE